MRRHTINSSISIKAILHRCSLPTLSDINLSLKDTKLPHSKRASRRIPTVYHRNRMADHRPTQGNGNNRCRLLLSPTSVNSESLRRDSRLQSHSRPLSGTMRQWFPLKQIPRPTPTTRSHATGPTQSTRWMQFRPLLLDSPILVHQTRRVKGILHQYSIETMRIANGNVDNLATARNRLWPMQAIHSSSISRNKPSSRPWVGKDGCFQAHMVRQQAII